VVIEVHPGGPTYDVDVELYPSRSNVPDSIKRMLVRYDGNLVMEIGARELEAIENPKLARMRIETFGRGRRNLIIVMPFDSKSKCEGDIPYSPSPDHEYPTSDSDDMRGDDIDYDSRAIIAVIHYMNAPEKFIRNISIRKCDPTLRSFSNAQHTQGVE
jgi:hypothetical protein